jgi:hypothetical protein
MNVTAAKSKIREAWDENPLAVIAVVSTAVIATAKLIDSVSAANNSRAWKKEVNRRDRNSRR